MEKKNDGWVLWYSVEWLRDQVENITAAIASRKDSEGNIHVEVMMTEDRDELFRRLMRDAINEVRCALVGIVDPEHPSNEIERERTIHLHLQLTESGDKKTVPAVVRALDDKVRRWLILYIVFQWLLMVSPKDAAIYEEELKQLKDDISDLAKSERWRGVRRRYFYY